MSVKIRMTRTGRQRAPFYRMVVADSRRARDGRVIEYVGRYQPLQPNDNLFIDEERVLYWLGQGALPSGTVRSLLKRVGLMRRFHEMRYGPSVAPGHEQYHQKKERAPEPSRAEKGAEAPPAGEAAGLGEQARAAEPTPAVVEPSPSATEPTALATEPTASAAEPTASATEPTASATASAQPESPESIEKVGIASPSQTVADPSAAAGTPGQAQQ